MSRTINRLAVCETSSFNGAATFSDTATFGANVIFDTAGAGQITFDLSAPSQTTNAVVDFPVFGDTATHTFLFDDVDATVSNKYFVSPKINQINDVNNNIALNICAPSGTTDNSTWQHLELCGTSGAVVEVNAVGAATDIGISLQPKGAGQIKLDQLTFPTGTGGAGQVLASDGAGNLSFVASIAPAEVTLTTNSVTPTNCTAIAIATASNTTYYLNLRAVGSTATDSDNVGAVFTLKAAFHRGTAGAASLHKIGGPTCDDVLAFEDDTAYAINTVANTTGGTIDVCITGDATDEVDWKVQYQTVSVAGAV